MAGPPRAGLLFLLYKENHLPLCLEQTPAGTKGSYRKMRGIEVSRGASDEWPNSIGAVKYRFRRQRETPVPDAAVRRSLDPVPYGSHHAYMRAIVH